MNNEAVEITAIKKRLSQISKEQSKLDKLISKQEEDDLYDDSLYKELEKLENERNDLNLKLDSLLN